MNGQFFIYNNRIFPSHRRIISPANRSFRYGDGLFETMRMRNQKIDYAEWHFERLFAGMNLLGMDRPAHFTPKEFMDAAVRLVAKCSAGNNARIRLMVFRGDGGLFDPDAAQVSYLLEAWRLPEAGRDKGLAIGVVEGLAKSCDLFSNIKSNNYLPSVIAAEYASRNQLDDAVILNTHGRVCETAIANLFIITGATIFTPPLSEGCVAGIMRRRLLEKGTPPGFAVVEKPLKMEEVAAAEEIFLTNAIQGIMPVARLGTSDYGSSKTGHVIAWLQNPNNLSQGQ